MTKLERYIITNQLYILEKLDKTNAIYFAKKRKAFEEGYTFEYQDSMSHLYDEMKEETQKEVRETLDLFCTLLRSYNTLPDKTSIDKADILFDGYDGNDPVESTMLGYATFLVEDENKFIEVKTDKPAHWAFNSHMEKRAQYNKMLEKWKSIPERFSLTAQQIKDIISS